MVWKADERYDSSLVCVAMSECSIDPPLTTHSSWNNGRNIIRHIQRITIFTLLSSYHISNFCAFHADSHKLDLHMSVSEYARPRSMIPFTA